MINKILFTKQNSMQRKIGGNLLQLPIGAVLWNYGSAKDYN